MSSHLSATFYKVPRESVDVEALAQQAARYMIIAAEDSEVLNRDPTRRNELYAQVSNRPDVKPGAFAPEEMVAFGEDPDVYLNRVDEELQKKTPPNSLEE